MWPIPESDYAGTHLKTECDMLLQIKVTSSSNINIQVVFFLYVSSLFVIRF